jgi:probable rRNA maturation factor
MAKKDHVRLEIQRAWDGPGVPDNKTLRRWARMALGRQRQQAGLVIRLVDSVESAELNQTYRHKVGPTNILSFPFSPPPGAESRLLGDLVLCVPVVTGEAAEQGKTPAAHWAHILIHGILHLRGFDHQDGDQAERMEARERRLLAKLGFPDPYADEMPTP